jgi:RimJ/RimL family protein N-acetyltransferase
LNGTATIGIFIGDKTKWGKGYGTKAVQLMVNVAFNKFKLRKLQAPIFSSNKRSINLFKKVGFRKEAVFKAHYLKSGKHLDLIFFCKFNRSAY